VRVPNRRTLAAAALGYAALAAWLAWPLPRVLGTMLPDPGAAWGVADLSLYVWTLAWDAHGVATAPLRVFDANVFHPAPNTLACSENLLGLLPVAGPVYWLTANPVLTYNVTALAVVWTVALTTFAAARAWTGSAAAAFLAGVAFAFGPSTLLGWSRMNEMPIHFLPLVLLLAWRAAVRPRPATLAALAVATAAQLWAGLYIGFELAAALLAFAPAVVWEARRRGRTGLAPAAALVLGGLAAIPVVLPYVRGIETGLLPAYPAGGPPILAATAPVALATLRRALGWPLLALAAVGAVARRPFPPHLRAALLAVAVLGVLLTLGYAIPGPYALAARLVPGFARMRAPIRFVVLPLLALALLAAAGAAALATAAARRGGRGAARLAAGALVAAAVVLALADAPGRRPPGRPAWLPPLLPVSTAAGDARGSAADRWLARHGATGPVLHLPVVNSVMDGAALVATGRHMVASSLHWLPLVNGYSGHAPASDRLLMTLAQRLPDARAFRDLCALTGLRWLVVHAGDAPLLARAWADGERQLPLAVAARPGTDVVYAVRAPCGDLVARLRDELERPDDGRTLRGLPRALPPGAGRARLRGALPRRFFAGLHTWLWVEVENRSRVTWPGLTARRAGRLALAARWRAPRTGALAYESVPVPVAADLAPGERLRAQVDTSVPPPGRYVLEVGLVTEGEGWLADRGAGRVHRRRVVVRPWPVS